MVFTVGLVSRLDEPQAIEVAAALAKQLRKKGISVMAELELAKRGRLGGGKDLADLKADLMVTVGGDGTVLKTAMSIPEQETPILAVNMGRRGYLTEVEPKNAGHAVEQFMKDKFTLEKRAKLAIQMNDTHIVDALNELVVSTGSPSKMLELRLGADSQPLLQFRGDGIIVSTTTGSTAYALSAGGPIVDSTVDAFVVTFICPLDFVRSTVVSMDRTLSLELISPKLKAQVVADGRYQRELTQDVRLSISKSKHYTSFVRLGNVKPLGSLTRLHELERASF
ncbi:MAG TPA: NAD(+)/NADH kinase [Candidatus Acidoferrales bacterium]|nr:NAD(+)/NADH kinase [Candidatus Acidoferrales bacterium]